MGQPILCLDFDGVLHSYESGWKGARRVSDPPVPGAMPFLVRAVAHFRVAILSSRSHQFGGRRAMKRWLMRHLEQAFLDDHRLLAQAQDVVGDPGWFMEPYDVECRDTTKALIKTLEFPRHKPPALVTVDDRAMQFDGYFPPMQDLINFRPWNRRGV